LIEKKEESTTIMELSLLILFFLKQIGKSEVNIPK